MDIIAHGLWANAIYRGVTTGKNIKPSKTKIWTVIFFGLIPDLLSFGPIFFWSIYEFLFRGMEIPFRGMHSQVSIPNYIFGTYNYTHSFIIFLAIFGIVWLIRKKPFWLMYGWGLHILIDIFSHAKEFFPTPFLFPISNFQVSGWSWHNPVFMAINYSLLVSVYLGLYLWHKWKNKRIIQKS